MTTSSSISRIIAGAFFAIVLGSSCLVAQITVSGKVLNSTGQPVGGVDIAIYVVGNKNAVDTTASNPTTGEYRFPNLHLAGAFDIAYTHTMYEFSVVSRLANQDNQHVSKVIYRKGELKPPTALDEQFLSARRIMFLASALTKSEDRRSFIDHFMHFGLSEVLDRNIDEMLSAKPSEKMRSVLEIEQKQTRSLTSEVLSNR